MRILIEFVRSQLYEAKCPSVKSKLGTVKGTARTALWI